MKGIKPVFTQYIVLAMFFLAAAPQGIAPVVLYKTPLHNFKSQSAYATRSGKKPINYAAINLYTLTIDLSKVSKANDTIYPYNKAITGFFRVPMALHNNSNDTLKFFSMSCSWWEFYHKSISDGIIFEQNDCARNFPVIIVVPPHHTFVNNVLLLFTDSVRGRSLKIGMNLIKYDRATYWSDFNLSDNLRFNMIWSNAIQVPFFINRRAGVRKIYVR